MDITVVFLADFLLPFYYRLENGFVRVHAILDCRQRSGLIRERLEGT
jgi:hypothetical protein